MNRRIPNLSRVFQAGAYGRPNTAWAPSSDASAVHWWNPARNRYSDAGSTVSAILDPVQQLNDLIGSDNLSAASTNRPTYDELAGKSVLRHVGGSTQYLRNASVSALQSVTLGFAAKFVTRGGTYHLMSCVGDGGSGQFVNVGERNDSLWFLSNNDAGTDVTNGTTDTAWHRFIVTRDASTLTLYMDGALVGSHSSGGGTMGAGFILGAYDVSSPAFPADMFCTGASLFNSVLGSTARTNLDSYLAATIPTTSATNLIVFDGDSLTFGEKSTAGNTYPQQVAAILGDGNQYRNKGVSAQKVSEILTRGPTVADLYWPYYTASNIYVLWAGTNDMSDALDSAATTYANFKSRCQAALAAGADKVVALTCLPRVSGNGSFEAYRQSFNTLMASLSGEVANVSLADVAAISGIGAAGDNLLTTYYDADQVHLNDDGYGLVAASVASAIQAVI